MKLSFPLFLVATLVACAGEEYDAWPDAAGGTCGSERVCEIEGQPCDERRQLRRLTAATPEL